MASISGNVTIAGDPDDWIACAFDADTHAFAAVATVAEGTYTISGLTAGKAYVVACRPKTGPVWAQNRVQLENDCTVPSTPDTKPYIYKASLLPDPNYSSYSLLLHCNGTNNSTSFVDSSSSPKTVTAFGDAKISTSHSKYGGASAYFDGTGDYLAVSDSSAFTLSNQDFTIECWIRFSTINISSTIIGQRDTSTSGVSYYFLHSTQSGYVGLNFAFSTTGTAGIFVTRAWTPSLDTWYHIAACRNGANLRLFVDGSQLGATYDIGDSTIFDSSADIKMGGVNTTTTNFLHGYLDDLRVTKGIALYTANFTPPAAQLLSFAVTGSTEPSWPTSLNDTINDSGIVWTNMGRMLQPLMQGPLIAA